jgi:UDP-N-acetylglucosamine 4,6-dehydratase
MDYKNKSILVTGGTGSFGNYICHRLLEREVKEIRILSRDEKKQYDMKIHYGNHPKLKFYLGDIRDYARVYDVTEGVDIVYQAAALKHVPACEIAPYEAVKTNVIGVENVIRAALKHKVSKYICVSTDKAVKPVNVMGMTKAIQERLVLNANHSPDNHGTKLCVVRYGNVMLSRGSVIPFFRRQLSRNEPLRITHENMTRFLLTLSDAIDLVMYATENTIGGETFVKKAPSSSILHLAQVLAEQNGKAFEYRTIGKFPGEKLHEILITEEELQRTEDKGDYFVVHPWWDNRIFEDLKEEYSSGSLIIQDDNEIKALLNRADQKADEVQFEIGEYSKV